MVINGLAPSISLFRVADCGGCQFGPVYRFVVGPGVRS